MSQNKPLRFVEIASTGRELHGLAADGTVWVYRDDGFTESRWEPLSMEAVD